MKQRDDYWTLDRRAGASKDYDCIFHDEDPMGFVMVSPPQKLHDYGKFTYNYEDTAHKKLKVIL